MRVFMGDMTFGGLHMGFHAPSYPPSHPFTSMSRL